METKNFKKTFELGPDLIITAERIICNDLHGYKLMSISNSAFFAISSVLDAEFNLPQIYASLTYLTGHGDDNYDGYKGSFSFTFKLNVKKPNYETEYIYHVVHYRSYVEFFLQEIVPKNDLRDINIMYAPNDEQFSDKDIRMFSLCFLKFAVMCTEGRPIEPFVKSSDSNLILFGYLNNEYFYKQYEKEEEYSQAQLVLEQQLQVHNNK